MLPLPDIRPSKVGQAAHSTGMAEGLEKDREEDRTLGEPRKLMRSGLAQGPSPKAPADSMKLPVEDVRHLAQDAA